MFLILSVLLSFIMTVNGQETLKSLQFRTRDITPAPTTADVTMSLWLDFVIYQCLFLGTINQNELVECNSPTQVGTYCDSALNGQLLVENDDADEVVINEITLYTDNVGVCTQYGINKWCIDQNDPSLTGNMQTGGNVGACSSDPITSDNCWLNPSSINICDELFPGESLTNYEAICVENAAQCGPPKQLMFFDLICSGTQSTATRWMDGTNTFAVTETCAPTSMTDNPTSITTNPTTPSAAPTKQPTTPSNNPTKSPTRDDEDSSGVSSEGGNQNK